MLVVNEMRRLYRSGKLDVNMFDNKDPEAYFSLMSRMGEYVDNLFLQVAASFFSRDIIVLPIREESSIIVLRGGEFGTDMPGTKMPIFMGFFEEGHGSHYQSVMPTRPSPALELVMENGGFNVGQFLGFPGQ